MLNARDVYADIAISRPPSGIERILSMIHLPIYDRFLSSYVNLNFKDALSRLLDGSEIKYETGKGVGLFIEKMHTPGGTNQLHVKEYHRRT